MEVAIASAGPAIRPLAAEQLYRATDLSKLTFETTAELKPLDGLVGQSRALEAIRFGTRVDKAGFNLFAIGPNGARMQDAIKAVLAAEAHAKPSPSDWLYVNNFANADRPIAIEVPAGRAREFQGVMRKLIDDLESALPAVFQSEDYQTRRGAIDEAFQKKQADAFSALREKAGAKSIVILRTPLGFALAPAQDGPVVPPRNSTRGRRPSAVRRKQTSRSSKRTSNILSINCRNGRSSDAMNLANSIAGPPNSPSTN